MTARIDVATLVAQMNDALASIHSTIEGLSTSAAESDTKLDELEQKRDMTLAELKAAYEKEQQELAAARQKELEEIAEQRRREDEEREARRRREDEERAARKAKEDEEKQGTFDTTTRNIEDEMDDLMDNVEQETAKKIAEGEAKLAELEEKRRELNRLIEEQMKAAVPPVPTRKRARTIRNSGAVASADSAPKDKSVQEEAPKPSDMPQVNAPAEEDKGPKGDDSQPQPKEPVAERSVEEGIRTQAAHRSEVTPPTEAVASKAEEAVKDEVSHEETPVEAALPANAPKPEPEPEAEPAQNLGQPVPEKPAENAAAPTVEVSQRDALAETEDSPIEFQSSVAAEEKGKAEKPEGTSEDVPDEAPSAVEQPSSQEPASEESAPVESKIAEEAPVREESHTIEEPAPGEAPDTEALKEDAPATKDNSTTLDDNPEKEQPVSHSEDAAASESSPADERVDTLKAKEEQTPVKDVDEATKERSVPEFSMKAVVDEHASEENHVVKSPDKVVEEAQPVAADNKEHHEKDSDEVREVHSKEVEREPSHEDETVVDGPSHLDEAASGEEAKHEESTVTLEAASAEPEEPAGALVEESDATPKEILKESDAATTEHAVSTQEDIVQDTESYSRSLALEDVPAQDTTPESDGVANELDAPEHKEAQDPEDATMQETTETESAKEPESPTVDTAPVHDKAPQHATAAPTIQTPKGVSMNVEDSSSEELDRKEHSKEQESNLDEDDSLAEDKAPMIEEAKHEESAAVGDKVIDGERAEEHATAAEEVSTEERSKPTDDDSLPEVQAGPDQSKEADGPEAADAPATGSSQSQKIDQVHDNQEVDLAHIKDVSGQESSATGGEVQTQPESQETPVEVSELPPKTQEEEEHLPTAVSKDLEDGDSKHGDTPHTTEEQLAGSVPDAAEDNSAVGPSDATAHSPADVNLTEDVVADRKTHTLAYESQDEDDKLEDDQDVREEASAALAEEDQNDKADLSDSLETPVEGEKAQPPSSELHEDPQESRDISLPAGHLPEETNTAKAVVDEGRAQDVEMSDEEEEAHDKSHLNDADQHNSQDAATAKRDSQVSSVGFESESKQLESHHAGVEAVDTSRDDVSFDGSDRSREPELSVITEYMEPAASAIDNTSELAAKSEDHFHPEFVSRNVSAAPDATLDSSYMTETTSMAADQSHEQEEQHESFLPTVSALGRKDDGFVSSDRAHLDEDEDDVSSSVQSVKEDDGIEDSSEASYNPFARANAASYEQPAYQSSDIPYNPFTLQTVVEEEPPLNPFTRKTTEDASEAPHSPFGRNTTSAAENFLRSASALSHSQPSSPEQSFARSASAQGRHDSVSSNNPFARSMTPSDQNVFPEATPFGQQDVAHSLNDPFARPPSAQGHYESEDTDTDDEEALAAAESTYKHLFPVRHSSPIANEDLASAAQNIERRQPTPQVPESAYSNPFAARSSPIGVDESVNSSAQQFTQESSPLSARHLAPTSLDSIQERYNSELEDIDSDSEEPESLTTSQQLPASQHRAIPTMPSIAERSFQDFEDSDKEEDWESRGPQNSGMDNVLTSAEYRPSPPPPPPRSLNSHNLYTEEAEDSSEDDGEMFKVNPAQPVQTSTLPSSQYSTAPPIPPPRVFSSQGHYSQQQEPEDSPTGEQKDWDDDFTHVQPSTVPFSQSSVPASGPPPPRAPSSLSQPQLHVEDSDEEHQAALPESTVKPNIPSALSLSDNRATPSPPPAPRAPSPQGLHNQEHPASSEDESPHSQNIARPGQFPFSSSSQSRATPPPSPPPRAPSSHGQYRQELEDSDDEEDEWDSKAALPGQTPSLSTLQHRATPPPPPPPPRAPSAQDRYRQELEDSDSEENEEAWEANQYGQTTNLMGASSLIGSNQLAQTNMTEPVSKESVPITSSQDLQSHQRNEEGEESDDSWENIGQRGEIHAVKSADPTSPALPTPQLRVDGYEQQWSNASNDRISTTSTYLQRHGPGDFTDTESQEYATPLPSAELGASSQYTQEGLDSPRHPESAGLKNIYDQSYNRGITSPSHVQDVSFGQESSLAEELARGDDSDSDGSEYEHAQAPAFLTQGFASQQQQQQQHHSNEPIVEQVVTISHSDEEDGPKTAVISSDEHPVQYASARFGSTSWRDELRSPVLFGATRQSRSGSFRDDTQQSLHEESDASHPTSPQPAHQPELHAQDPYMQQQSQVYDQEVRDQPPQLHGQDIHAPQSPEQHPYAPETEHPFGPAGGSWEQPQTESAQPKASQPELQVEISGAQAEEDDGQRTPHLIPHQSEQQADISLLALRQESPATPASRGTPSRGLAFSRHNPERPQTPPSQTVREEDVGPELIVPRDVTNVPWHARQDSVPYSVQSQSTIDSMASSPVHSALHADKHEPVIRDSWPASMHGLTRPRNDSTLTDRDDYDPFRYEGGAKAMRGPSGSVGSASDSPHRNSVSNSSPGSLISRMRGIFENSQAKQEPASPARSRPVSGIFHPVQRVKTSGGEDSPGYERKAGFLNEVEDEIDEQSALLRNSAGGLEAN
ncbi:hypothetical protein LY78DRAFT_640916 [Colletotrichum sublineola]|nr:hypothetical protein LY78DRAFT_640916 [Colletotrichum sublineola]